MQIIQCLIMDGRRCMLLAGYFITIVMKKSLFLIYTSHDCRIWQASKHFRVTFPLNTPRDK